MTVHRFARRARRAARCVIDYLAIKPDEEVSIICDRQLGLDVPNAIAAEIEGLGRRPPVIVFDPPLSANFKTHFPRPLAEAMFASDVVITIEHIPNLHTEAVNRAIYQYGVRGIGITIGSTDDFVEDSMLVDPRLLEEIVYATEAAIGPGGKLHITAPNGTNFETIVEQINIGGQPGHGHGVEPGTWVHWPHGEIYMTPPVAQSSNGRLVLDLVQTMQGFSYPDEPVTFEIRDDEVVEIQGGEEAALIRDQFARYPNDRYHVEVALGINPLVPWHCRNPVAGIRRAGFVYFGFGSPKVAGGGRNADHHMDHGTFSATLTTGGRTVVKDGTLLPLSRFAERLRTLNLEDL